MSEMGAAARLRRHLSLKLAPFRPVRGGLMVEGVVRAVIGELTRGLSTGLVVRASSPSCPDCAPALHCAPCPDCHLECAAGGAPVAPSQVSFGLLALTHLSVACIFFLLGVISARPRASPPPARAGQPLAQQATLADIDFATEARLQAAQARGGK